jgi:hypothetical protein
MKKNLPRKKIGWHWKNANDAECGGACSCWGLTGILSLAKGSRIAGQCAETCLYLFFACHTNHAISVEIRSSQL